MAQKNDKDPLKKLYQVLIKFKIEDIRENIVTEFPALRRAGLWSDIAAASYTPSPRIVATHVCQLLSEYPQDKIESIVEILQLKALYSCSSKVWYLYELLQEEDENDDLVTDNIGRLCVKVGKSLGIRTRGVRGPDDCVLLAIGTGTRKVNAALHPQLRCVLITAKHDSFLENIANVLGYRSVKDCHLSGQHAPSLLQMLRQKRGACSLRELLPQNIQNTSIHQNSRPVRTATGLYFGKRVFDEVVEDENKIRLQTLTVRSEAQPPHLRCQLTLSSKDVIGSLRDMLQMGIIESDNVFCEMIKKSRNDVTIKFEND